MVFMVLGLLFTSLLMGLIEGFMAQMNMDFDAQYQKRLDYLIIWINKIEKSKKDGYIFPVLYQNMTRFVEEAFMYDFNMLIEDKFNFYQCLTPTLQTELIDLLFGNFKRSFRHIFDPCERGFVNELIINMFTKILPDREYVAEPG